MYHIPRFNTGDFPCGPVVKNLPDNVGDMGSIPGPANKIPHVTRQLSPCSTTTEACVPYNLCSAIRGHHSEKSLQLESSSHPHNLRKACTQQQIPSAA